MDITVVEPKDYMEYTPGILRAFVSRTEEEEEAMGRRLCVPLTV